MILPDIVLPSRQNQIWTESGIDTLKDCYDKKHFKSYPHLIEYRYNSRGFRDTEWPKTLKELKDAIWCVGDSFTVGIGSPREHTWPYILQQQIGCRVINISMDGASNNWISRRAVDIIKNINPTAMIVQWSYIERREQPNKCLDQAWTQMYASVRDQLWPDNISLENFNILPEHIQNELLTGHTQFQVWKCGLTDEQLRLPYIKSTDEEDIDNTIKCLKSVNQVATPTNKLIHSFIPDFVNRLYKQSFTNQLSKISSTLIIPEIIKIDTARDGYHYDIKTATKFVESIVPLLS
jgi:hypothetical protein